MKIKVQRLRQLVQLLKLLSMNSACFVPLSRSRSSDRDGVPG